MTNEQKFEKLRGYYEKLTEWQNEHGLDDKGSFHRSMSVTLDTDDHRKKSRRLRDMKSKKKPHVAVTGNTSSGKSTAVNAFLKADVEAVSRFPATQRFIKITLSSDSRSFCRHGNTEYNFSRPDDVKKFKELTNENKEKSCAPIEVFLSPDRSDVRQFLSAAEIIDCPGSENVESLQDKSLLDGADIVVLLADVMSQLSDIQIGEQLKESQLLCPPELFVVFNKCDEFDDEDPAKVERITANFENNSKEILNRHKIKLTGIHFVSAMEALQNSTSGSQSLSRDRTERDGEWKKFVTGIRKFVDDRKFIENRLSRAMTTAASGLKEELQSGLDELRGRVEKLEKVIKKHRDLTKSFLDRRSESEAKAYAEKFERNREIEKKDDDSAFLTFCLDQLFGELLKLWHDVKGEYAGDGKLGEFYDATQERLAKKAEMRRPGETAEFYKEMMRRKNKWIEEETRKREAAYEDDLQTGKTVGRVVGGFVGGAAAGAAAAAAGLSAKLTVGVGIGVAANTGAAALGGGASLTLASSAAGAAVTAGVGGGLVATTGAGGAITAVGVTGAAASASGAGLAATGSTGMAAAFGTVTLGSTAMTAIAATGGIIIGAVAIGIIGSWLWAGARRAYRGDGDKISKDRKEIAMKYIQWIFENQKMVLEELERAKSQFENGIRELQKIQDNLEETFPN